MGQHSAQVKVAQIFKPACYKLALHGRPHVEQATKTRNTTKDVAPIAAPPVLGRVMPGLRGSGIGQRWVEARTMEQAKGNAAKERVVRSTTSGVRTSRRGVKAGIPAGAGNSW